MSQEIVESELRKTLTLRARRMRSSTIPTGVDLTKPQSCRDDVILFRGEPVNRRRIVLLTPACTAATCSMCPLPNEALNPMREGMPSWQINNQFDWAMLDTNNKLDMITVYNNGNFFSDKEVHPDTRNHIYQRFKNSSARILLVESLPQFITEQKISSAKKILGDKKLVVAIGLQSANDEIRALSVNTTCTRSSFELAVDLLSKHEFDTEAFLMIKPPLLTEEEGIKDVIDSIAYLNRLGIQNPILCTTRVAPNTILSEMYLKNMYKPPWLWSVIEIISQSKLRWPNVRPRIVVGELIQEQNNSSVCASNCANCTNDLVRLIAEFNISQNPAELLNYDCPCRKDYKCMMQSEISLAEISIANRLKTFLQSN